MTDEVMTATMTDLDSKPSAARMMRFRNYVCRHIVVLLLLAFTVWAAFAHTQLLIVGIVTGAIYGISALGLTIVYGVLRFPNIAQGLGMILAGYLTFVFATGRVKRSALVVGDTVLPFNFNALPKASEPFLGLSFGYGMLLAIIASAAATSLIFLLIDRFVYRPARLRRSNTPLMQTILSFGVTYVLVGVTAMVWGIYPRNLTEGIHPAVEYPFGILLKNDQLFIIAAAAISAFAAYYVLYRTTLGKAMRATTDNVALARACGINVERVVTATWILSGVLAAIGGTLIGLQAQITPQLGLALVLPLFAAAVLGGIGNPIGALGGGLAVGVLQEVSVAYVDPGYKISVAFLVLVIVLVLRPSDSLRSRAV